mmetsp:Transcript_21811/g.19344  ORF Transcript_21811/g.19344 Transcript_21811/m.19344 type:complete len:112 (+) Transcript_21811:32-367(+)
MKQEITDFRTTPGQHLAPKIAYEPEMEDKESAIFNIWASGRLYWKKSSFCIDQCVDYNKSDGSGADGVCFQNCLTSYGAALKTLETEANNFSLAVKDIEARGGNLFDEYLI